MLGRKLKQGKSTEVYECVWMGTCVWMGVSVCVFLLYRGGGIREIFPRKVTFKQRPEYSEKLSSRQWKLLSRVQLFAIPWTIQSIHGILQTSILEWVAFPFSRGSSQPRNRTQVSHIAGGFFTSWARREAHPGRGHSICKGPRRKDTPRRRARAQWAMGREMKVGLREEGGRQDLGSLGKQPAF